MKKTLTLCAVLITSCMTTNSMAFDKKPMECRTALTGSARIDSGLFREMRAKSAAKSDWESKAYNTYAPAFGNWNKARNKNVQCSNNGTFWNPIQVCAATAEPCAPK